MFRIIFQYKFSLQQLLFNKEFLFKMNTSVYLVFMMAAFTSVSARKSESDGHSEGVTFVVDRQAQADASRIGRPLDEKAQVRLTVLERQIDSFLSNLTSIKIQNFDSLTLLTNQEYKKTEKTCEDTIERRINEKLQKVPTCHKVIIALGTLLKKLDREIDQSSWILGQPIPNAENQALDSISRSGAALVNLRGLETRLNAMDQELFTEPSDECSRPVHDTLMKMKTRLDLLSRQHLEDFKSDAVNRFTQQILEGQYETTNQDFQDLEAIFDSDLEGNLALIAAINKTFNSNSRENGIQCLVDLLNFDAILSFLNVVDGAYKKTGMEFLIELMSSCTSSIDSPKFLRLALDAKKFFGWELKQTFPPSYQQLIWGGSMCIRNKQTNQYLVSDRSQMQRRQRGQENTSGTSGNEHPSLPIQTSRIAINRHGQVDNEKGRTEFCGWEFYPIISGNNASVPEFIIRQRIQNDWNWNMNVDRGNHTDSTTVRVSPAATKENSRWQVRSMDGGNVFSLQGFDSGLVVVNHGFVNGTEGDNFLCSSTSGREKRNLVIQSFNRYCQWYLENPFE